MSACRRCGAAIEWTVTEAGRRMPIEPRPDESGNLAVHRGQDGVLHARLLKDPDAALLRDGEHRARPHWANCPGASR